MSRAPAPRLTLTCPDCATVFDATPSARGKAFACVKCGKLLPVPFGIKGPPRSLAQKAVTVVGVCLFLGCVTFMTLSNAPGFVAAGRNVRKAQAQRPVRDLCWSEVLLHQRTGKWAVAGPLPAAIPARGEVAFPPDPVFQSLGFTPSSTAFQFEVMLEGTGGVRCLGRYHGGVMAALATPGGAAIQP